MSFSSDINENSFFVECKHAESTLLERCFYDRENVVSLKKDVLLAIIMILFYQMDSASTFFFQQFFARHFNSCFFHEAN